MAIPITYQARKDYWSSEMVARKVTPFQKFTLEFLELEKARGIEWVNTWTLIKNFCYHRAEREPRLATSHRRSLNKIRAAGLLRSNWQADAYALPIETVSGS